MRLWGEKWRVRGKEGRTHWCPGGRLVDAAAHTRGRIKRFTELMCKLSPPASLLWMVVSEIPDESLNRIDGNFAERGSRGGLRRPPPSFIGCHVLDNLIDPSYGTARYTSPCVRNQSHAIFRAVESPRRINPSRHPVIKLQIVVWRRSSQPPRFWSGRQPSRFRSGAQCVSHAWRAW